MRYILLVFSIAFLASCGDDTEGLTPEEYISENNLQATELENGVYIVIKESGNDIKPAIGRRGSCKFCRETYGWNCIWWN